MHKIVGGLAAAAIAFGGVGGGVAVTHSTPAFASTSSHARTAEQAYADSLPYTTYGDSGSVVMGLQFFLRLHGYSYLNATGYYGVNTRRAVEDFKAKHGRVANADVGQLTWRKIITTPSQLPKKLMVPQLSPGASLRGSAGWHLLDMTRLMDPLPWFTWDSSANTYSGPLLSSVKTFQSRVGLRPSGIFGPQTTGKMDTVLAIAGMWCSC